MQAAVSLALSVVLTWPAVAKAQPEPSDIDDVPDWPAQPAAVEPAPTEPESTSSPQPEAPELTEAEQPQTDPALAEALGEPRSAVEPEPTSASEVAPASAQAAPLGTDGGPKSATDNRKLALGLLVAGSGFVVLGGATAGIYAGTEKRCGGSCVGGILVAATGLAGVVVGALLFARSNRQAAPHGRAAPVARWWPGRGFRF